MATARNSTCRKNVGRSPLSWLLCRCNVWMRRLSCPSCSGIAPPIWLASTFSCSKYLWVRQGPWKCGLCFRARQKRTQRLMTRPWIMGRTRVCLATRGWSPIFYSATPAALAAPRGCRACQALVRQVNSGGGIDEAGSSCHRSQAALCRRAYFGACQMFPRWLDCQLSRAMTQRADSHRDGRPDAGSRCSIMNSDELGGGEAVMIV